MLVTQWKRSQIVHTYLWPRIAKESIIFSFDIALGKSLYLCTSVVSNSTCLPASRLGLASSGPCPSSPTNSLCAAQPHNLTNLSKNHVTITNAHQTGTELAMEPAEPITNVLGYTNAPSAPQGSNPMPNSQTPGHPSFRRYV